MSFSSMAQHLTTPSVVMEGRTKVKNDDLIAAYPDGITITGFDEINGQHGKYFVYQFQEDTTKFANAGMVLGKIFAEAIEQYGSLDSANLQLRKEGGLKVVLKKSTTRTGNTVTTVDVVG